MLAIAILTIYIYIQAKHEISLQNLTQGLGYTLCRRLSSEVNFFIGTRVYLYANIIIYKFRISGFNSFCQNCVCPAFGCLEGRSIFLNQNELGTTRRVQYIRHRLGLGATYTNPARVVTMELKLRQENT